MTKLITTMNVTMMMMMTMMTMVVMVIIVTMLQLLMIMMMTIMMMMMMMMEMIMVMMMMTPTTTMLMLNHVICKGDKWKCIIEVTSKCLDSGHPDHSGVETDEAVCVSSPIPTPA